MNDCDSVNKGDAAEFAVENDHCISLDDIRTNDLRNIFTADLSASDMDSKTRATSSTNGVKQVSSNGKNSSSALLHISSDEDGDGDSDNVTDTLDGLDKTDKLKTHITSIIEGILYETGPITGTVLGTVTQVTKRRDSTQNSRDATMHSSSSLLNQPSTSLSQSSGKSRQPLARQDIGAKFEAMTSVKVKLYRLDPALIAMYTSPKNKKKSRSICSISSSEKHGDNTVESDSDGIDDVPLSKMLASKSHKAAGKGSKQKALANKSSEGQTTKSMSLKTKQSPGNGKKKAGALKTHSVILSSDDEIEQYRGGCHVPLSAFESSSAAKKATKKSNYSTDSDGESGVQKKAAKPDSLAEESSSVSAKKTAREQCLAEANDKRFDLILASSLIGNAAKSKLPSPVVPSPSTNCTTLTSPVIANSHDNNLTTDSAPSLSGKTCDISTVAVSTPAAVKQSQKTVEIEWDSDTECINIVIRRKGSGALTGGVKDAPENCITVKKNSSGSSALPLTASEDSADLVTIDDDDSEDNVDVTLGSDHRVNGSKKRSLHSRGKKSKKKKTK